MELSKQQQDVINWVRTGDGHLNLIAYAGTGKTSTLMEIAKNIQGRGFCGAFNKAIADEFTSRLNAQGSRHVKGSTLHSAGYGAWRNAQTSGGKLDVDGRKLLSLVKRNVPEAQYNKTYAGALRDLVGYGKQACFGVEGMPNIGESKAWEDIIDYYDLKDEFGDRSVNGVVENAMKIYRKSLDMCNEVIDFDDMLLAPLYYQSPFQTYDWVMVDEAQDTNLARRVIVENMLGTNSRLVAVGDPHQAIYGFAGATSNAMDCIERSMRQHGTFARLPLSVTYRCPRAVVELAKTWVPDFEAHEKNAAGAVHTIDHQMFLKYNFDPGSDVILCRNTRPLLGVAKVLRRRGYPCVVEGQAAKGLMALAMKWGDIKIEDYLDKLDGYTNAEVARLNAKGKEAEAERMEEKAEIMHDLADYSDIVTAGDLEAKIEQLFTDTNRQDVIRLCTIHRSKGREWERVFLVGRNRYMPSQWAKQEWELEQEKNLMYVAVTRAKEELVEVDVPKKDKRGDKEWWE